MKDLNHLYLLKNKIKNWLLNGIKLSIFKIISFIIKSHGNKIIKERRKERGAMMIL